MSKFSHVEQFRGRWRATVLFPDDTRRKGALRAAKRDAAADARKLIAERDALSRAGSHFTLARAQDELRAQLRRRRRRDGTIEAAEAQYRALCECWLPEVELRLLTRDSVHWMIDKRLREGVSPATVNKQVGHLARLIDIGIRDGHIDTPQNAAKSADKPSVRQPARVSISLTRVKEAECVALYHGLRREALTIRLLRLSGMRRSEAARIRVKDIQLEAGVLDIPQPKVASQPRQLLLTDSLKATLLELAQGLTPNATLFDRAMDITLALRRVARLVQNPALRAHAIRHGVGDRVADVTRGDVTAIARVLGHSPGSVRMTMRYAQAADERLRSAQRALE